MPHFLEGGVAKQIILNSTTRSTSITCLYHYGPVDICFTLCILTQYYIIYFIAKTVSALVLGRSFQLALLSLWHTTITVLFFEHFLSFWQYEMLKAHFIYFLPPCKNQALLQEAWFLSLETGIGNQEPDTGSGHCSQVPSPDRAILVCLLTSPFQSYRFHSFQLLQSAPYSSTLLSEIVSYICKTFRFFCLILHSVLEPLNS